MERLFIQLSDDVYIYKSKELILMTGFVLQGHFFQYRDDIRETLQIINQTLGDEQTERAVV